MKVALYARVSKDEPEGSERFQDVNTQLEDLRKWAASMGYEVHREYIDHGKGDDATRPGLLAMDRDGHQRKFEKILVWRMDRFTREKPFVALGRIQRLRDRRIGVVSMNEPGIDTSVESQTADLVLFVLLWQAAGEKESISMRTKAGIRQKRALGQWKGGRPRKKGGPSDGNEKRGR